jgi:streptogramin lyase
VSVRDLPLWVASGAGSIWVALERSHTVGRLSPSGQSLAEIRVDSAPRGVVFGGGSIWVATEGGLSEIDTDTNTVVRELRLVNVTHDVGGTSVAYLNGLVWVSIE